MASYVILNPVTGPGTDHQKTRFIRDGFSLLAFLFPGIWLLCHRLWIFGIAALLLQGIGLEIMGMPGLWPAGFALLLAVSIATAVEGGILSISSLSGRGFVTQDVVSARNLSEAEDIYFSGIGNEARPEIRPTQWDIPAANAGSAPTGAALGLIGYNGGRL
jgi:hypothetical protein